MNFVPDRSEAKDVPYFEDVREGDGWQGQGTRKTVDQLKTEVGDAVGRLGGFVRFFQQGTFHIGNTKRAGLQLHYTIDGRPARIDIAALPVRQPANKEKSIKMALYMLRDTFNGLWFMQQLSPGYAALMPFMIADEQGHTVSQLWAESAVMNKLLPPPDADFDIIDAE
jgi:hypothetical protein